MIGPGSDKNWFIWNLVFSVSKQSRNKYLTIMYYQCLRTVLDSSAVSIIADWMNWQILCLSIQPIKTWCQILCTAQCSCNVLAKFWRLVGCSKRLHWQLKLTAGTIAFRICMTCYRWKSTVLPGKLFFSKKNAKKQPFLADTISGFPDFGGFMPNYWA